VNLKSILILFFILISHYSFSQEKKYFTIDIGFSQNHKGFFTLFNGIMDLGGSYNYRIAGKFYTGASFHIDYLKRINTASETIIYKPNLNLHYNFKMTHRIYLTAQAALGYSFVTLSNKEFSYKETQQGINPGTEFRIFWRTDRKTDFYLFGRYDYIYLAKDENFTRLDYYRKIHLTSFGLGIKIKNKEESPD
jgi:hypothetical protein